MMKVILGQTNQGKKFYYKIYEKFVGVKNESIIISFEVIYYFDIINLIK